MRLFTGIDVPAKVASRIGLAVDRLRPLARLRWSPLANLHITTKFIGEWPEARLDELRSTLGGLRRPGDISIEISGFGWFPNPHRPRVFFLGLRVGEALAELARETDEALERIGVQREKNRYSPHLTLARVDGEADLTGIRRAVAEMGQPGSAGMGAWAADRFHLYLSAPGPSGSKYSKLASFPLSEESGSPPAQPVTQEASSEKR